MKRGQTGNAIVEFALILPFMLLVTLGVIALSRYAYLGIVVANAAHAGAAYGAQLNGGGSNDAAGMIAAAEKDAAGNGVGTITSPAPSPTTFCMYWVYSSPLPSANPSPNPGCSPSVAGTKTAIVYVSVQVTGKASSGLPNVPFLPSQMTITSTATERVQQ